LRSLVAGPDGRPVVGPKWRVSTAGGNFPKWRADGKELFFRGPGGEVMAVDVVAKAGAMQTDLPRQLFAMSAVAGWDVAPDGQRFLMSVPVNLLAAADAPVEPMTVVLNWEAGLKK
jgi:hypothetical protein